MSSAIVSVVVSTKLLPTPGRPGAPGPDSPGPSLGARKTPHHPRERATRLGRHVPECPFWDVRAWRILRCAGVATARRMRILGTCPVG
jgi:hypothetical protein